MATRNAKRALFNSRTEDASPTQTRAVRLWLFGDWNDTRDVNEFGDNESRFERNWRGVSELMPFGRGSDW